MRSIAAATASAIEQTVTTPTYLVFLGFATPLRLSTRGTVKFQNADWVEAGMEVSLGHSPSLRLFNQNAQIGQIFMTEGTAGRVVRVYQFYDASAIMLMFAGEIGMAQIGSYVEVAIKHRAPNRTPRDFVQEPVFRHLLPAGTRIQTPQQTVVIE